MLYESHLSAAERAAWPLDTAVAWDRIDRRAAAAEADLHAALHDAAVIEGYLPLYVPRLMRLLWDDVDATAVLSVELFDGLKHFTALKRYLDRVGHASAEEIEARLVEARRGTLDRTLDENDPLVHLTNFMCSELFAAHFFQKIGHRTREPVLRGLLALMARDEFRHSAGAGDLVRVRVEADPAAAERVLATAEDFRHYGSDIVEVPQAEALDFRAILAMNRKIRQVCGMAPTDHLREAMPDGA